MRRRSFLGKLARGAAARAQQQTQSRPAPGTFDVHGGAVIERAAGGKPPSGKVLALIQPHTDDIPVFAAGTAFKLIDEGCTAFLIRFSNDGMAGPGWNAQTLIASARGNNAVAQRENAR